MPNTTCISSLLSDLDKQHIVQSDIAPFILALKDEPLVDVQLVGYSFEKRPVHLLTLGKGPTVIFAWTQMHGNEATATASVFDLIDTLLLNTHKEIDGWGSTFTIHILPMLNPDGAERCIRQNAQSIDINRDARELQTPEGQLLMRMVNQLAPDIGFNLHDQSPYYQCGENTNPATIAFLAPSFDEDKTIDSARERAMLLISHMNNIIQSHIPNCVARYDDTYAVRSFGDNIAAKKVSTILIESGAARGDENRQIARRMNVISMISALEYLTHTAEQKPHDIYPNASVENYFAIPENVGETVSSLVMRNVSFTGLSPYRIGVSIKQTARYSNRFFIDFTGDLNTQVGLQEFDAAGLHYKQGIVFTPTKPMILDNNAYIDLLRAGFLYFDDPNGLVNNTSEHDMCYSNMPLHDSDAFVLKKPAYCLLVDTHQANCVKAVLLNGKIVSLE